MPAEAYPAGWAPGRSRSPRAPDADLSGANLGGAILEGANLRSADFSGANLSGTEFCRTTMPDGSINNSGGC